MRSLHDLLSIFSKLSALDINDYNWLTTVTSFKTTFLYQVSLTLYFRFNSFFIHKPYWKGLKHFNILHLLKLSFCQSENYVNAFNNVGFSTVLRKIFIFHIKTIFDGTYKRIFGISLSCQKCTFICHLKTFYHLI